MKNSNKSRKLLKELSRDPRLKKVIANASRQARGTASTQVETATSVFLLLSAIASRFSKKRRARAIDEMADMVQLLFQASLVLKENVFDRPEVKKFLRQRSKQLYEFAQERFATIFPKTKVIRPTQSTRSARGRRLA